MTSIVSAAAPGSVPVPPPCGAWSGTDAHDVRAAPSGIARLLLTRGPDGSPRSFTDLLDADAVDELVSRRGLRTPFLRVAQDGTTLADRAFTAGGGVGAGVTDQVSDDALVRPLRRRRHPRAAGPAPRSGRRCTAFSQDLAADLGHPVQVNAYVTPPQSRGFSDHYDVHDVFVLQIEGEKRWPIHAPIHPVTPAHPALDRPARPTSKRPPRAEPRPRCGPASRATASTCPRGYLHAADGPRRRQHPRDHRRPCLARPRPRGAAARRRPRPPRRADEDVRGSLPLGVDVSGRRTGLTVRPRGSCVPACCVPCRRPSVSEVARRMAAPAPNAPRGRRPSARWPSCVPAPCSSDAVLKVRPHLAPAASSPNPTAALCCAAVRATYSCATSTSTPSSDCSTATRSLPPRSVSDLARRLLLSGVAVQG